MIRTDGRPTIAMRGTLPEEREQARRRKAASKAAKLGSPRGCDPSEALRLRIRP